VCIAQSTARTPARRQNGPRSGTHLGTSAATPAQPRQKSPKASIVRGSHHFDECCSNAQSRLVRTPKLGQPYQGFRIAAIGGSRLLYPFNGNAVTDSGKGHLLDCSLATGGTTPPNRQRGGRAVALCLRMLHWWHSLWVPNSITGGWRRHAPTGVSFGTLLV